MKKRCFIVGAGAFNGFLTNSNADAVDDSLIDSNADVVDNFLIDSNADVVDDFPVNSSVCRLSPEPGDLVIAADGGYRYLQKLGVEPDILMGDFDSLEIVPEHRHLIRHSPIKDDTDMALAVAWAEKAGYETFFLYGGLGGRLDHSLANLLL
ncbi:MAG: thiamine diphosphokinase [Lachnospiraceae bacterium]|nr:thiamine diphosphokinase [Lachnospiraceae bacterium]